ncbi:MAG TPA: glutamate-5-semialdehyde dehydrogenase [Methylomirabilota bacterium]|jgi:glutamate-5-semialdehyde dehydrogenase|nr:glutamate-5-semialdehyde dehydrogenase [Methylomirabilota bacterium]
MATDIRELVESRARAAREASRALALASTRVKNDGLLQMARGVEEKARVIIRANRADLERARTQGHPRAFLDRLTLTDARIEEMAAGIRQIAALPDPIGETVRMWRRPNGMEVGRVRVPLGVVGIIYESRPNVTADAAALCVKAGNACVLRGGSEALESNAVIAAILAKGLEKTALPPEAIGFIDVPDRAAVDLLLGLDRYLDLIVPRGGEAFVRMVAERATMPVLKHDKGVCHVYVDADADPAMAAEIALNAKVQRPGVCNAMETLLVHHAVALTFLPGVAERFREAGVELRGCPRTRELVPWAKPATDEDWSTEYLDLVLSVRVVDDFEAAVAHIRKYGSGLAEAIVTREYARARRFLAEVDAACVLVNASTRLCDGGQFGMGAELGISTSKLHARGPVGVEELTTTKFVVLGDGQLRE